MNFSSNTLISPGRHREIQVTSPMASRMSSRLRRGGTSAAAVTDIARGSAFASRVASSRDPAGLLEATRSPTLADDAPLPSGIVDERKPERLALVRVFSFSVIGFLAFWRFPFPRVNCSLRRRAKLAGKLLEA